MNQGDIMDYTNEHMMARVYGFLPDPVMTIVPLTIGTLITKLADRINTYMRDQHVDQVDDSMILATLLGLLDDTDYGMRAIRSTLLFDTPASLTALQQLDGTPCRTPLRGWGSVFDRHARYGLVAVALDQRHHYEMTAEDVEIAATMYDDDRSQRWW